MPGVCETLFLRWFRVAYVDDDRALWKAAIKWAAIATAFLVAVLGLVFVVWFEFTDKRHVP